MKAPKRTHAKYGYAQRLQAFYAKIEQNENGCWIWVACHNKAGYGSFRSDNGSVLAHRWSYEQFIGQIPKELEIDHLCRNRACVNPYHLEPVTSAINSQRGEVGLYSNGLKTHCKYGHPFDEKNTYWSKGRRWCIECRDRREAMRPPRKSKLKG